MACINRLMPLVIHFQYGETLRRPITLQDVADALDIHKSTVSMALSGKGTLSDATRRRVRQAAQELGYEPNPLAQRLARGTLNPTVCILGGVLDQGLATEKMLRIQSELWTRGFETPLSIWHTPELSSEHAQRQVEQVGDLWRQRPRAIVCAVHRLPDSFLEELAHFHRRGGVVVSYDAAVPFGWDQVVFDREENAYRAARVLLDAGHRHIGLGMSRVRDPDRPTDPQAQRLRGFLRALDEFGAPRRDDWIFQTDPYEPGGADLARRFLALEERPTALAVVNDYLALALMTELERAGVRIPRDLSVVGHDNQPVAAYCPVPLTTLAQPADRIAAAVVELLDARMRDGAAPPRQVRIDSGYVVRDSVAPPEAR